MDRVLASALGGFAAVAQPKMLNALNILSTMSDFFTFAPLGEYGANVIIVPEYFYTP